MLQRSYLAETPLFKDAPLNTGLTKPFAAPVPTESSCQQVLSCETMDSKDLARQRAEGLRLLRLIARYAARRTYSSDLSRALAEVLQTGTLEASQSPHGRTPAAEKTGEPGAD